MKKSVTWLAVMALVLAAAPWLAGGGEPVAILASSAGLFLAMLLVGMQPGVPRVVSRRLSVAAAIFAIWGSASLLWSANSFDSLQWLVVMGMAVAVFYLAALLSGKQQTRRILVFGYLLLVGIFCIGAMFDYVLGDFPRLVGWFYWPNPAAAYLMPAIFLIMGFLRDSRGGIARWSWIAGFGLVAAALLLTDSRGALLVIVPFFVVDILWKRERRKNWINIVFAVGAAAVLTVAMVQARGMTQHSFGAMMAIPGARLVGDSGESTSTADRVMYLQSGIEIIVRHPLLGTGAGTFRDVHPYYQKGVTDASANMHNFYGQLATDLGIVGLLIFLLCIVMYLKDIVVKARLLSEDFARPILLGLLALLAHFALDIDASYPALLMLAMLLAGALYGIAHSEQADRGRGAQIGTLIMLVAFALAALLYQSSVYISKAKTAAGDSDYQLAAEYYERARGLGLANPDALTAEGIMRLALADSPKSDELSLALDLAKRAESRDPFDSQHYQLEAKVLSAEGKYAASVKPLQRALTLDPHNRPDLALDLADLMVYLERKDEASKVIVGMTGRYTDAVIRNRSNNSDVRPALAAMWALSGNLKLDTGDIIGATADSRRALTIYPKSLRGRALKARLNKL